MKKDDKNLIIKISIIVSIIIFFVLGLFLLDKSKGNYTESMILYQEDNAINYKVYLKENDFFEDNYLEMNKTYIASLINYIDIDFNYNISFNKLVNDSYYYTIEGVMSADKTNGVDGNYWEKSYTLYTSENYNKDNISNVNITDNIKIDYQKYNELLTTFKSQFGLAIDGKLKILLNVYHIVGNDEFSNIEKESSIILEIPLTSLTIEVPIKTDNLKDNGIIASEKIYSEDIIFKVYKVVGYGLLVLSLILFILIAYLIILSSLKVSKYTKTLRKILRVYDSIIVTVKELPDTNNLDIVNVNDFDELLDAHSEVRKPINLKLNKNNATFVLINEGIAWKYILNKDEIERK